jgi:hypothetical protein
MDSVWSKQKDEIRQLRALVSHFLRKKLMGFGDGNWQIFVSALAFYLFF